MFSFSSFTPLVGLDISTTAIKAVELRPAGKGWRLFKAGVKSLPPDAVGEGKVKDVEAVSAAIRELMSEAKITTKQAAISISGSAVIIKQIQLDPLGELQLEDQINLEAEEYIPFDIEDIFLDFQILHTPKAKKKKKGKKAKTEPAPGALDDEEKMDVLLVACKKELLENYQQALEEAGLEPKMCDLDLFAAANAYEQIIDPPKLGKKDEGSVVAVVNTGATILNITTLKRKPKQPAGIPVFARDQAFGGKRLTEELQRSLDLSVEEAERFISAGGPDDGSPPPESYEADILGPFIDQLAGQIKQALDFYASSNADDPIQKLCLSGGCALIPDIENRLGTILEMPVAVADPFVPLKSGKITDSMSPCLNMPPRFMVACGLAMRGRDL
ncbi:MAG: type IV pilus assembly protein PilM [Magnetococcales bacterium]|nr:type IV pilus assembly protein PilM [Magnetococcales bacterium]